MPLSRDDMRKLYLAGTVHFPPNPPRLARINIEEYTFGPDPTGAKKAVMILRELHDADEDVHIVRYVLLEDVSAVFIPENSHEVILHRGTWLIGPEVQGLAVPANLTACPQTNPPPMIATERYGIVHVPEHAAMTVESGATTPSCTTAGEAYETHQSMIAYKGCC